ncbi:MAG: hypothetical protein ABJH72_21865 [Reichenbachiella sp.]|uniref:hypothetical protein n=1 Tax=Reichenbachiella sp. TaxID=2184521 RepID=UPI003263C17F
MSTTTTTRMQIDNDSSVEWLKLGPVMLALLFLQLPIFAQSPELLMPGKISTQYKERDMTITVDGNHLLYSVHSYDNAHRMIVEMKKNGSIWSDAEVSSFSGKYKDLEPMFAPSGKRLYFASDRPLFETDDTNDYNIWYVDKVKEGWSEPIPLDSLINTDGDEFYPSVSNKGTLYFTATREGGKGKEDIFFSLYQNGRFQRPLSMDSAINTPTYEFNSFIDPDENYILFSSYGRSDGLGGGDIYISHKINDQWQPAINLGDQINSEKLDYCPFVSADAQVFYFTSNRKDKSEAGSVSELRRLMNNTQNGFDNIYHLPIKNVIINTRSTK